MSEAQTASAGDGGTAAPERHVYFFGAGQADGTKDMKRVLGGKGANLAEMTNIGVPVPPGFTIACQVCVQYLRDGTVPPGLRDEVAEHLRRVEEASGRGFGDPRNPLLVSVRSGAPVSMPGMMETILNLGLNDRTVLGLAQASGNARFAYDSYRRFIQMYSDVVLGVPLHNFEHLLRAKRVLAGVETDAELSEEVLRNLVEEYKALVRNALGRPFPTDPVEQLWGAVEAVWKSWTLKKAVDYRRVNGIDERLGTAVNVVSMVFGPRASAASTASS
jgi:pyruvate, orthophosphate dikinase